MGDDGSSSRLARWCTDIANFMVHYLPEDVEITVLPVRLPRLPASVTRAREERGGRWSWLDIRLEGARREQSGCPQ